MAIFQMDDATSFGMAECTLLIIRRETKQFQAVFRQMLVVAKFVGWPLNNTVKCRPGGGTMRFASARNLHFRFGRDGMTLRLFSLVKMSTCKHIQE